MLSKLSLELLCLALSFFVLTKPVFAQVVINEIHPAPAVGNDWIELFNLNDQTISLTGWTVEDSTSTLSTNPPLTSQSIPANSFLVIEVSNRLNNTGDDVKLKNSLNQLIDSYSFPTTPTDQSWSRVPDGLGPFSLTSATRASSNSASLPAPSPSPSPSPSPAPSPQPTPPPVATPQPLASHIIFSEIMACPNTGEPEWIELQNLENVSASVQNWQIKDAQNNSRFFSTEVSAQGFAVIQIAPAMMNNTGGDQLSLLRPDGVLLSQASYTSCTKGKSLTLKDGVWVISEPTPGLENSMTQEESSPTPEPTAPPQPVESISNSASPTAKVSTTSAFQNLELFPAQLSTPSSYTSFSFQAPPQPTSRSQAQQALQSSPQHLGPLLIIISSLPFFTLACWLFYGWYTEQNENEAPLFS